MPQAALTITYATRSNDRTPLDLLLIEHEVDSLSMLKTDYVTKYLKAPECPVLAVPIRVE